MRDINNFSPNTLMIFDNNYDNLLAFNGLSIDASNGVYSKYSKNETDKIFRNQFNKLIGIDFKNTIPIKRIQAWRNHRNEVFTLIEDTLVDKMVSGWNQNNARFMEYVDEINLAEGDQNSFLVNDPSLLQVSKFAGNHHDIVRQRVLPGKTFSIETSPYVIKVYADFEMFMLGKIDYSDMIDRMYKSIEQFRYNALYTAFMSMDSSLPADMKANIALAEATKGDVVEMCEAVRAATGYDVVIVGTRTAIQKLQNTVNYSIWSNDMKQEQHENGVLGMWEGYNTIALQRTNKVGTRDSVFTPADNKKLFILPVDPDFKPIKHVQEGGILFTERGADGLMEDMTVESEIMFREGCGVVINQLFGLITITN